MLSLRNILLMVLALVFATGTALYVKSWLENERALIAANQKTNVQIVKQAAAIKQATKENEWLAAKFKLEEVARNRMSRDFIRSRQKCAPPFPTFGMRHPCPDTA